MKRLLLLCLLGLLLGAGSPPRHDWLYVTSFQRGELLVYDLESGQLVHRLPVEDKAGIIGFNLSPDGKRLYVLDGSSRLRELQASDLKPVRTAELPHRVLMLGGPPVTTLSSDGAWLFAPTFEYASAARGLRVYNTHTGQFLPLGLGSRGLLLGGPGGRLYEVNGDTVRRLVQDKAGWEEQASQKLPFQGISEASLSPDGKTLYALEFLHEQKAPWRLAIWSPRGFQSVDLRQRLSVPDDSNGGTSSLAVSPDGTMLAVQRGPRAWVLDSQSLALRHTLELPSVGDALWFPGNSRLLVLNHSGSLLQVDLASGASRQLLQLKPEAPPFQILVAPSP